MDEAQVIDLMREVMLVCMKIALPVLIVSIIIGLVIAIFQAATQIHEQTLTFVPKLLVIALMLLLLGSYINTTVGDFTRDIFSLMASM